MVQAMAGRRAMKNYINDVYSKWRNSLDPKMRLALEIIEEYDVCPDCKSKDHRTDMLMFGGHYCKDGERIAPEDLP